MESETGPPNKHAVVLAQKISDTILHLSSFVNITMPVSLYAIYFFAISVRLSSDFAHILISTIYHSYITVSSSSVNGDIAIQWEWSKLDPSQNPNPLTNYDKTLQN